ncbi:MAG TPA: SxtJ family membrane protein [Candidatus Omnitrophota bacterium]|nr:SxtJ family membrane protein [Candidatus Omnitrophota bacterium]HPT39216.1 SxtJ family membrane protein [Candidatus Omnitrophota bacterium]
MAGIKTDNVILKKFGLLTASGFILAGLINFIKNNYFLTWTIACALFFVLLAIFRPVLLKYFYLFWMRLAGILSWVNTCILLNLIFYCIFTPAGLFMRLVRVDFLARKFKKTRNSYWKPKITNRPLPADYRRQS